MTLFAISITFIGLFLISLKDLYPEFTQAGFTLAFSVIGIYIKSSTATIIVNINR